MKLGNLKDKFRTIFIKDKDLVVKNGTTRIRTKKNYAAYLPFGFNTPIQTKRVAVLVHVFYVELCEEIREYISNIPCDVDVFISTDTAEKEKAITYILKDFDKGAVTIRVYPNRGRDIAPLLMMLKEVYQDYDLFLHIHSKRSLYDKNLDLWRSHSYKALLGGIEIVSNIIFMLEKDDIGIVFPQHFEYIKDKLEWGGNYKLLHDTLASLSIDVNKRMLLEFPSGSMFWGKMKAIEPLINAGFTMEDFPVESGQVDATLAHVIERSILYISEFVGYKWVRVSTDKDYELNVMPKDIEDIESIVNKIYKPVLKKYY